MPIIIIIPVIIISIFDFVISACRLNFSAKDKNSLDLCKNFLRAAGAGALPKKDNFSRKIKAIITL